MLKLALPVVLTYLGLMLMGVVDILFVGRVSPEAIGAVGIGTALFSGFMVFGLGLLSGLDYLVSFAYGAKRPRDGYRALTHSLILLTVLCSILTVILIWLSQNLHVIGINPEVRRDAGRYLHAIAWSLWPTLVFSAFRQYLTANGSAQPAMIILFVANVVNALGNNALVLGRWGAPALGAYGSGLVTLSCRVLMMVAIVLYVLHWDSRRDRFFKTEKFSINLSTFRDLLQLGLPSAFQMVFEVGIFALSTTLAARLTTHALAAHQIVLNIASLTFMVPLGISSATAVLVGQEIGKGNPREAARTGWRGLALGVGFMAISALTLLTFSRPLLLLFTQSEDVILLAKKILLIAALFQLSDGTQTVTTGALRGLADTRSAMIANLMGHWLIGFPIGLLLCFWMGWGLVGIWTGLSFGLTAVAAGLLWSWRRQSLRKIREAETA